MPTRERRSACADRLTRACRPARRRRAGLLALVSLLLPALVLAGCGYGSRKQETRMPGEEFTPNGRKLSADSLTIGYFPNITHATALVGLQKGFFAKELRGTRLRTQVFNAGPSAMEALNAGAVDIAWVGPAPAVNGFVRSRGRNLRIISGSASGGASLVVNPDRIRSPADVRGRRIATPQIGGTQDTALLHWATARGWRVDPQTGDGDVRVVRQDNKEIPTAFRRGAVDGAWVPEPVAAQLVAAGGRKLVDERDLWPGGRFVTTHVVVSQTFLDRHPDVVEAVLRGSVRTNAWIAAHREPAKAEVNAAVRRLTGRPLPDDVLDMAWRAVDILDDPLADTLAAEVDHALTTGLLTSADVEGIYDLRPLNRVLAAEGRPPVDDAGLAVPGD
ncbi:ABC transporter substrate-binding protein [Streptomyces buecherae]|uniref:ABC transporter substrate-binding protein n=1 Tax=Streptomyces buecherae TaxID=2763006 RepID=A0A7H8N574_9ACTN|nr:ABC transporter substrate-binding protein [Streptomyces buecherae]